MINKILSLNINNDSRKLFALRLKKLRVAENISQKNIAADLSLSLSGYGNYEKRSAVPSWEALIDIANYFCVSIDYLTGRTEEDLRKYLLLAAFEKIKNFFSETGKIYVPVIHSNPTVFSDDEVKLSFWRGFLKGQYDNSWEFLPIPNEIFIENCIRKKFLLTWATKESKAKK